MSDSTSTSTDATAPSSGGTSTPSGTSPPSTNRSPTAPADGTAERGAIRSIALAIGRLFGDAAILGLGVILLALLFLSTGWPRWAFYVHLVLGVVLYVVLTPPWIRGS